MRSFFLENDRKRKKREYFMLHWGIPSCIIWLFKFLWMFFACVKMAGSPKAAVRGCCRGMDCGGFFPKMEGQIRHRRRNGCTGSQSAAGALFC